MNKSQRKALKNLRPELQKKIIEQASAGKLSFTPSQHQQQPANEGLFAALATKDQTTLL